MDDFSSMKYRLLTATLFLIVSVFYLVESALTQWCQKRYHFNNDSGTLRSPAPTGSLLYPDNVHCGWSITIPTNYQHAKLSFSTFKLESCPECECDYVQVFDRIGPKKISLGKFCGEVKPGPFFSTEQTLMVEFKSDHGTSNDGFVASYSSVLPGAVCRNATQLDASIGSIHSPEFPELNYPNNMNCVWKITTPQNTRIRLIVRSMSIQRCGRVGTVDSCSCDFLQIRDGQFSSDRLLATLCGAQPPKDLYSSGRHLWVRFRSDASVVRSGFVALFSSAKIIEGYSCPANWKYPFKCPEELDLNSNKTGACCYDNGPDCCKPGGRRCTDKGAGERDYCPRPNDDPKLRYCCTKKGKPSCCASSGVCPNFKLTFLLGVVAHVYHVLSKHVNYIIMY